MIFDFVLGAFWTTLPSLSEHCLLLDRVLHELLFQFWFVLASFRSPFPSL